MRLAVVGHSLVDPRQALFCSTIRELGHEVLEIYPERWYWQHREGGVRVKNEGDMARYHFTWEAFKRVRDFRPDLIYSMSEWWAFQSQVSAKWAERLRVPLVLFFWENLRRPPRDIFQRLRPSLVVCGNSRAERLVRPHAKTVRLPQVGIDTWWFSPSNRVRDIDVLYVGRLVLEKGVEYIRRAFPTATLVSGVDYAELPPYYQRARVFCSFPYDTPTWVEQAGNYTNLEALSCGTPVVTSDAGAIPEWLKGCGGAIIVPQRDWRKMKQAVDDLLGDEDKRERMGMAGRRFVVEHYENSVVAKKLMKALEELV